MYARAKLAMIIHYQSLFDTHVLSHSRTVREHPIRLNGAQAGEKKLPDFQFRQLFQQQSEW
jgi:hypothetical protein